MLTNEAVHAEEDDDMMAFTDKEATSKLASYFADNKNNNTIRELKAQNLLTYDSNKINSINESFQE